MPGLLESHHATLGAPQNESTADMSASQLATSKRHETHLHHDVRRQLCLQFDKRLLRGSVGCCFPFRSRRRRTLTMRNQFFTPKLSTGVASRDPKSAARAPQHCRNAFRSMLVSASTHLGPSETGQSCPPCLGNELRFIGVWSTGRGRWQAATSSLRDC